MSGEGVVALASHHTTRNPIELHGGGIVEIYSPNTLPQRLSPHKIFSKGSLNLPLISPTKILLKVP
nr:MAG TPA: hypothetical protein [Caudoviricetes sp.]